MANNVTADIHALDIGESRPAVFLNAWPRVRMGLMPLASLRLTVALFAMAIFLVFAGTLAQVDKDMWGVIRDYFRAKITWIDFQVFFPPSFFPDMGSVPGGFYFPGGWTIGVALALNLVSAHVLRFRIQVQGTRLWIGLGLTGLGVLMVWMVIAAGHNPDGIQAPDFAWSTFWSVLQAVLVLAWITAFFAAIMLGRDYAVQRWALGSLVVVLTAWLGWVFWQGSEAPLSDSSLRILWQLLQGGFAAVVLLVGSIALFKKRAGIVLLHSGVGLLMLGELLVSSAVEEQMEIKEGETANFARDIRTVELAVIDTSHEDEDHVVVIPDSILLNGDVVSHELLPFDLRIDRYLDNSDLRRVKKSDDENLATNGSGLKWRAEELRAAVGTDAGGAIDFASAYLSFYPKGESKRLGTYLVSQWMAYQNVAEKITVDGKNFDVYLRFKRTYKPYSVTLNDVRADKYLGTSRVKNYSSDVRLVDEGRDIDRDIRIWMNNPLRYAGETFYQSSYQPAMRNVKEGTVLSVVSNRGWMIPYVACMLVATGMLAHFSIVLLRFLNRQIPSGPAEEQAWKATTDKVRISKKPEVDWWSIVFPWAVVIVMAWWLTAKGKPAPVSADGMDIVEFGKIPIVYQGRVKPVDTLARNSLRIISNKQTCATTDSSTGDSRLPQVPAMRWFLDTVTGQPKAGQYRVFRIENLDVLNLLGLERRKGFRYAVNEFYDQIAVFEKEAKKVSEMQPAEMGVYERKVAELDKRIRTFTSLLASFRPENFPSFPTEEDIKNDPDKAKSVREEIMQRALTVRQQSEELASRQPPLAVPFGKREPWQPYSTAFNLGYLQRNLLGQEINPATMSWATMLNAYINGDTTEFNKEIADYHALLAHETPEDVDLAKNEFESFFNHVQPFYHCSVVYLLAFVLSALGWLGCTRTLNRAALWLVLLALVVHTCALVSRIYISGRPPVTNLYSSAVFIGWGAVILSLIIELVYCRRDRKGGRAVSPTVGIGTVIASVSGFATLLIAHFLAGDGDTFVVLEAVLDTQFWLATHVTCITLGYATTFVAGMLGLLYVIRGCLTPSLTAAKGKDLARMIYGTLCFSILFSFVGTVLGGLWADDSWGRFWGWDPKENGALIIVLWNALVLHARWGAIVKDRGLAVLSIAGNITTSWSWFGVNELGVGLHSYGFTEGVVRTLGLFVGSQLVFIILGLLPLAWWWSFRTAAEQS